MINFLRTSTCTSNIGSCRVEGNAFVVHGIGGQYVDKLFITINVLGCSHTIEIEVKCNADVVVVPFSSVVWTS